MTPAVLVEGLEFSYTQKQVLKGLSLKVGAGQFFAIAGPNGGGKSTLFRILSTLLVPSAGKVEIMGADLKRNPLEVRKQMGVLFQSPALDKKLTVFENLFCHARLFGIEKAEIKSRITDVLKRFDLERSRDSRVETLSGGMKRRVEIAKALISKPRVLLLDEPTTGLDPVARTEVWNFISALRKETGVTVLFTTHLLDEADACDGLVFLDDGKIILEGTPDSLKALIGGDIISLKTKNVAGLSDAIWNKFQLRGKIVGEELRIEKERGAEFIPALVESFAKEIDSVTLGRPTLEDLFIQKTGKRLLGV